MSPAKTTTAKTTQASTTSAKRKSSRRRGAPKPERTLVILGASGDLTSRLLLPGLATLLRSEPDRRVRVLGAAMEDFTPAQWTKRVRSALTAAKVEAEVREAVSMGARGVPFFLFNDKYTAPGALPLDAFRQALRQIAEEARGERSADQA